MNNKETNSDICFDNEVCIVGNGGDTYVSGSIAKFATDNEDLLYMDEPYDIEAFSESVACKNISCAPKIVEYINMIPLFEFLSLINKTIKTNKMNKFIVVHWVGAVSTALDNAKYFYNVNRKASAHYFVDDASIYRIVKDSNSSWHCGGGLQGNGGHKFFNICFNSNSIGIEMCCKKSGGVLTISDVVMNNTAKLIAHLMKKYDIGLDMVIRHYDVTGKSCPGDLLNDDAWLTFKEKIKEAMDSHETRVENFTNRGIINSPNIWKNENNWVSVPNALAIVDKNTGNGVWKSEESDINIHWCHPHLISLCGKQVIDSKELWMDFNAYVSVARGLALLCKAFGRKSSIGDFKHWGLAFAKTLVDENVITNDDIPEDLDAPITNKLFIKILSKFI